MLDKLVERVRGGDASLEIADYKLLLAEYAKDPSKVDEAQAVIDILAVKAKDPDFNDKFHSEFGGAEGNFHKCPVLAALYYGNTELFEMLLKIPEINLGKSISAKHKEINVGVPPINPADSHKILMQLYERLTPDEIVSTGLFNLAVFFGDKELVDKFLSNESKVKFADVANFQGARLAFPINYCAALSKDSPYKEIFVEMLENPDVIKGLGANKGLVLQLLLEGNFDAVITLKDKGYVLDTTKNNAISPLITGLAKIPEGAVVDIEKIRKVCSYVIENEQKENVEMFADNLDVVKNKAVLGLINEAVNAKIAPSVVISDGKQQMDGNFLGRLSVRLKKVFSYEKSDEMGSTILASTAYNDPSKAVVTSAVPLSLSGRESPNLSEQLISELQSDLVDISRRNVDTDVMLKRQLATQLSNRIFADMAPGVSVGNDVKSEVYSAVLTALRDPQKADEAIANAISLAAKEASKGYSTQQR